MPALQQDYELQALLAVGAMAEVWRGLDVQRGTPVAIKVLHSHLRRQTEVRSLFLAEQQLVTALPRHPGVVHGLYSDDTAERPYLVMSLAPGVDLRRWVAPIVGGTLGSSATAAVERAALPRSVAFAVVRHTALAAAHLHQQGWVHGDIGPTNIIVADALPTATVLRQPASVVLCDLGIMRRIGETGPVRGTHAYMAPEQVRGEAWTAATDVFALGTLLWELVRGEHLFHRGPTFLSAAAVVEAAVPPLGDRALDALLLRMLSKTVASRMASATDVVAALDNLSH